MHRATRLTFGTLGIGLLAAFLVLGLSGATAVHAGPAVPATHGGVPLAAGHSASTAAIHPDTVLPAQLRVLNAVENTSSPSATAYDFYVAGTPTWVDVAYATTPSVYQNFSAGTYSITVYANHTTATLPPLLLTASVVLAAGTFYTFTLDGPYGGTLTSHLYVDNGQTPPANDVTLRFVNTVSNAGPLEVQANGSTWFASVAYGTASPYTNITAQTVDNVNIEYASNQSVVLALGNVSFAPGAPISIYGVGLVGNSTANSSVVALMPLDGPFAQPTTIGVSFSGTPGLYSTIPAWLNFTFVWTNAFGYTPDPSTLGGSVQVYNILSDSVQTQWNFTIVSGQASYSLALNATTLGCAYGDPTCTNTLIGAYTFNVFTSINAVGFEGTPATGESDSGTYTEFITYAPVWALVAPTTATVPAGNITVSVAYNAQFVTAVDLSIFAGPTLVYTGTFLQSSPGISVAKVWYEGTPGVYNVSIAGVMIYGTEYLNSSITVTAPTATGGGTVYQNTTNWINTTGGTSATGYFGLNAPVSGTLFLLVGLIVGILAALVAARMMMSEPPAKPAQPWADQKSGDAANTCSVCGKSFGSADELSAHAKSEHGMS